VNCQPYQAAIRAVTCEGRSRPEFSASAYVNELATNALKDAFPGEQAGTDVMLRQGSAKLTILVEDNGVGRPEDAQARLGSGLVRLLVEQSGGSIKRESATPDYRVVITIPNDLSKGRDAMRYRDASGISFCNGS